MSANPIAIVVGDVGLRPGGGRPAARGRIGKPVQFLLIIRNDGVRTIRTTTFVQAIKA